MPIKMELYIPCSWKESLSASGLSISAKIELHIDNRVSYETGRNLSIAHLVWPMVEHGPTNQAVHAGAHASVGGSFFSRGMPEAANQ